MRNNMSEYDDWDDDFDDDFEEMNNMSFDDFLQYLYENRHQFFGPIDDEEMLEYEELENKLNNFIKTPIPLAFTNINGEKAPISFQCGEWEVYTN